MGDLAGKNIPPPPISVPYEWCDIREALPTTDVKWMKDFHLFRSMVSSSSNLKDVILCTELLYRER